MAFCSFPVKSDTDLIIVKDILDCRKSCSDLHILHLSDLHPIHDTAKI